MMGQNGHNGAHRTAVLDNGITVVTEEVPVFSSASLGIWVNAGTRHETDENNGISHFLEHILFKGTTKHSARELAEIMDGVGGHMNAFTEKEQTCFYARVTDRHVPLALELLAEMLRESVYDPEEIQREKGVVLEEIRNYEDAPDELIFDLFTQSLWNGHPLGRPILGTAQVIQSLSRDLLLDYVERNYSPENLLVTAAGRLRHQDMVDLVRRLFGSMEPGGERPEQRAPRLRPGHMVRFKDCEQVYLCLGAEGLRVDDEDRYRLSVLDSILGGSVSSRLFQEIREKRGLVYTVASFMNSYRDGGLFGIYAGTSRENLPQVISLCYDTLEDLARRGVTREEVARAQEHIKGTLLLALESLTSRMMRIARSYMYHDRIIPLEEVLGKIESVTVEEVNELAVRLLDPRKYSAGILGPVDEAHPPDLPPVEA